MIDDDLGSLSMLRKDLQTIHYDVITAENGEEGLRLAATIQPDLILLDVTMPQMGGFAVCEQLKNNPVTRSIPVIFLTVRDEEEDIVTGLGMGAVDYVVKPYILKELQVRIRKALMLRDEQRRLHDEVQQLKSNFAAMVANELRTPVTVIAGFAELLEQKLAHLEPSVQVAYLQEIVQQVDLLSNLIDDFQYLLHSELILEEVNLIRIVQVAVEKSRKPIEQKGQRLILNLPDEPSLMIRGNGRYLFTAVKHLVSNAHKFTNAGGMITVTVMPMEDQVRIQVADTGIGIPQDQQRWIFEKYYQGPQGLTRRPKGMGLGLTIVRSVAEQHHGSIGFESQPGQGSRFWLDLPLDPSTVPG